MLKNEIIISDNTTLKAIKPTFERHEMERNFFASKLL